MEDTTDGPRELVAGCNWSTVRAFTMVELGFWTNGFLGLHSLRFYLPGGICKFCCMLGEVVGALQASDIEPDWQHKPTFASV